MRGASVRSVTGLPGSDAPGQHLRSGRDHGDPVRRVRSARRFFLPGDSLLFTAGLRVGGGLVAPLLLLLVLPPRAAVAGNLVGWWIGRRAGPAVFDRAEPRLFEPRLFEARHVDRARTFFERNGARAVIRARFVPVVRTFVTVMAGGTRMDVGRFAVYSLIGGIAWTSGVTLVGYWLGQVTLVRDHVGLFTAGHSVRGERPSAATSGSATARMPAALG
jgi:membrane-associated protein